MSSKPKFDLYGDGDVFSSLSFGGMSGSTNFGLVENAITHPANGYFVTNNYTTGTLTIAANPTISPVGAGLILNSSGNL